MRVVLASPGPVDPQGHAVAAVAAMRNAGIEVVYAGLNQSAPAMVRATLQEDADVLGLYVAASEYVKAVEEVLAGLRREGVRDVAVMVAGRFSDEAAERLRSGGAARVFLGDSGPGDMVEYVKNVVCQKEET